MYFYFGMHRMCYIKNQLLIKSEAIAYNDVFHVYGKKKYLLALSRKGDDGPITVCKTARSLRDGCILVLEWTFHFANMITRTRASRIADSF